MKSKEKALNFSVGDKCLRFSKRLGEALEHLKQRNAVTWPIKQESELSFFCLSSMRRSASYAGGAWATADKGEELVIKWKNIFRRSMTAVYAVMQ
jgi:hypothetical protein